MRGGLGVKLVFTLEAAVAGVYVSLTKGLFTIFLVSVGMDASGVSLVMLLSSLLAIVVGFLLYVRPGFMVRRVKLKLLIFHASERFVWIFLPLFRGRLIISILFSVYMVLSLLISMFISLAIYGSSDEATIRDIVAMRSVAGGASSTIGFALGAFLLAFLPKSGKFFYIFTLGSAIGLISTIIIGFAELKHLERVEIPEAIEAPEKIYTASLFIISLLFSFNTLGIFWIPYLMHELKGSDFLAALINLMGTISSMVASMVWKGKGLRAFRLALLLNALTPLMIWLVPLPHVHPTISIYASFAYTGANFLGALLFASYNRWFGAVKSSVLLILLANLSQLLSGLMGLSVQGQYSTAFLTAFMVGLLSTLIAITTIPEVAVVPEETANQYSRIIYMNTLLGYRLAIEASRKTVLLTLRIMALFAVLILLYIVYRVLWLLAG